MTTMRVLLLALALLVTEPLVRAEWTQQVVATGLNNPRGIAVSDDGTVYVAESGSGGSTEADRVTLAGQEGLYCTGLSGRIRKIQVSEDGISIVERFSAVMESVVGPEESCNPLPVGTAAVGPNSLAIENDSSLIVTVGLGGHPSNQERLGEHFGTVRRVVLESFVYPVANIAEYEWEFNPVGEPDSNPYGVAIVSDGIVVADAGADALFSVDNDGVISTLVAMPDLGQVEMPELSCGNNDTLPAGTMVNIASVPTALAVGPEGDLYVGLLTGFPFAVGAAKVYRMGPEERTEPTIFVDNLTQVTGIDFDIDGSLYIAQMSDESLLEIETCMVANPPPLGSVIKVSPDGTRETIGQLPYVGDVAVDKATGAVYVTTGSILSTSAGGGSVVLLTETIEPTAAPTSDSTEAPTDARGETSTILPSSTPPPDATSTATRVCPWYFGC